MTNLNTMINLANRYADGHMTIYKFTNGYRCCVGTAFPENCAPLCPDLEQAALAAVKRFALRGYEYDCLHDEIPTFNTKGE